MFVARYRLIHASALRTVDPVAVVLDTAEFRGIAVEIDVTDIAATPSIVLAINYVGATGNSLLLDTAAITGVSTNFLRIYPTITAVANVALNEVLSSHTEITVTHADVDDITYSVHAELLP